MKFDGFAAKVDPKPKMDPTGMEEVISRIRLATGRDISTYATTFIEMVLANRMVETSTFSLAEYIKILDADSTEQISLLQSLNVSYSLFFRSPLDYSIIDRFILPSMMQRKGKNNASSIRIWSAGCADGSEPYSLAMIGEEMNRLPVTKHPLLIFATDISTIALAKAGAGVYHPSALQNVSMARMEAFFHKVSDMYQVSRYLKRNIEFSEYDLLDQKTSTPPAAIFGEFEMVICSNLMVYYRREVQEQILEKLHKSLCHKGYLMVDPSEKSIVKSFRGFRLYSALGNIFVKN